MRKNGSKKSRRFVRNKNKLRCQHPSPRPHRLTTDFENRSSLRSLLPAPVAPLREQLRAMCLIRLSSLRFRAGLNHRCVALLCEYAPLHSAARVIHQPAW